MTKPALQACQEALATKLKGDGSNSWETRVRVSHTNSKTPYPYLIYFWSGGGELNSIIADDAEFRMSVKVVTPKMAEAMSGKQRISELLNNKGEQESPTDYLNGGTDWEILTCTEEDAIYSPEVEKDTITKYHVGAIFRIAMQSRS